MGIEADRMVRTDFPALVKTVKLLEMKLRTLTLRCAKLEAHSPKTLQRPSMNIPPHNEKLTEIGIEPRG